VRSLPGVTTMPTQYYRRARTSAPRRPDPPIPTSPRPSRYAPAAVVKPKREARPSVGLARNRMIRSEAGRGRKWERGVGDRSYGRGSPSARPQTAQHARIFHFHTPPPPRAPPRPTALWARPKIGGLLLCGLWSAIWAGGVGVEGAAGCASEHRAVTWA